jgi:hypothetical protein
VLEHLDFEWHNGVQMGGPAQRVISKTNSPRLHQNLLTMKRRKRKRKHKQDSQPAEQVVVQGETEQSASSVEIQVEIDMVEIENMASRVETRDEVENPTTPVVISAQTEEPNPDSAAPTGADRRTHPRYAFTAAVEVVAPEPGERLKTRVRDLSQQGCFVDTDSPLALESSRPRGRRITSS